jgi:hypothetical protein
MRPAAGLALALLASGLLPPAVRADGGGTAMFGVPPAPVPAAAGSSGAGAGAVCRAKPDAGSSAPTADGGEAPASADTVTLIDLEDMAAELGRLSRTLAQVAPTPPVPPTPRPTVRPRAAPRARATARDARAAVRAERRARVATDTTLAVRPGSRLELHNFGGQIDIVTWPRHAVRVQAEHARRDRVDIARHEGLMRVTTVAPEGPAQSVEYRLTVPAWLPVSLTGIYNDVTADGLTGGITVETVRGDIEVRRASGAIELRSVEGLVDLADAKGRIKVSSVNDGVRLVKVVGDVQAEAVNGDIQLLDLTSNNVEATTVNGAVLFDGKMADGGTYRFSTHNGDIAFAMTDRANATVNVSTYAGEFETAFPIRLSSTKPGKRFAFALGNGKARVDLESFQGAIQLFRPGDREVLQRFRESWSESRRERVRDVKWIWKGDWKHELDHDPDHPDEGDDPDPDGDTAPVGHRKKK